MFSRRRPLDEVIRRAHLEELVARRGLDALCGEGGCELSGGEKQRIAIARALLKQSSILLADEATAALDAQTAHEITQDILSLTGITRVVVTHRLEASLLECYDEILVLKDGRIAETGTFAELVQRGRLFQRYVQIGALTPPPEAGILYLERGCRHAQKYCTRT